MENKELILKAYEAMKNAYAPYSNFKVGTALLADNKVFTGCNIENSSYGATICAERVAISKAISEGAKELTKIVIVSSSNDFTTPCGICRQVLAEFMPEGKVVLTNDKEVKELNVKELLPNSFKLDI